MLHLPRVERQRAAFLKPDQIRLGCDKLFLQEQTLDCDCEASATVMGWLARIRGVQSPNVDGRHRTGASCGNITGRSKDTEPVASDSENQPCSRYSLTRRSKLFTDLQRGARSTARLNCLQTRLRHHSGALLCVPDVYEVRITLFPFLEVPCTRPQNLHQLSVRRSTRSTLSQIKSAHAVRAKHTTWSPNEPEHLHHHHKSSNLTSVVGVPRGTSSAIAVGRNTPTSSTTQTKSTIGKRLSGISLRGVCEGYKFASPAPAFQKTWPRSLGLRDLGPKSTPKADVAVL